MSKLPTAESIPKPIGDMLLNVPHVITQNGAYYHYSDVCSAIESHTAAHTAALRERVKELEAENTRLKSVMRLIGDYCKKSMSDVLGVIKEEIGGGFTALTDEQYNHPSNINRDNPIIGYKNVKK